MEHKKTKKKEHEKPSLLGKRKTFHAQNCPNIKKIKPGNIIP